MNRGYHMRTRRRKVRRIYRPLLFPGCFAALLFLGSLLPLTSAFAYEDDTLAKQTQNPIANLISLPLQSNWDFGIGPADSMRYTLNVQPVIPFSLNEEYNLITRTIIPYIYAEAPVRNRNDKSGLGDILQSFFFSPKKPVNGWLLGAGPVLLYPSATKDELGKEKWAAGPTAVVLKQVSGWTYGMLFNHLWSFAGDDDRSNVNATFLQPFVSFTTRTFTTFGVNTESTYDWKNSDWTVPINVTATQLLKLGNQPFSLTLGWRYYAEAPSGGPDWGLRFVVTLLFPKG